MTEWCYTATATHQKPVARNVAYAVQVVEMCDRLAVTLRVLFQHRMRATSIAAKPRLENGQLGELEHIEIAETPWREHSDLDYLDRGTCAHDDNGVLITHAILTIDLAPGLTGPVSRVPTMTATTPLHRMEAEDLTIDESFRAGFPVEVEAAD